MAHGRHIAHRKIAISQRKIVRFLMKFGTKQPI